MDLTFKFDLLHFLSPMVLSITYQLGALVFSTFLLSSVPRPYVSSVGPPLHSVHCISIFLS